MRDVACQLVVVEVQLRQLGEVAQFCRDVACQLVVEDLQLRQLGEGA